MKFTIDTNEQDYSKGLTEAKSLTALNAFLDLWVPYVPDAKAVVNKMTDSDFKDFKKGLEIERSGKFAGENWAHRYGSVLLPENLMKATLLADQFQAPFIIALQRLVRQK